MSAAVPSDGAEHGLRDGEDVDAEVIEVGIEADVTETPRVVHPDRRRPGRRRAVGPDAAGGPTRRRRDRTRTRAVRSPNDRRRRSDRSSRSAARSTVRSCRSRPPCPSGRTSDDPRRRRRPRTNAGGATRSSTQQSMMRRPTVAVDRRAPDLGLQTLGHGSRALEIGLAGVRQESFERSGELIAVDQERVVAVRRVDLEVLGDRHRASASVSAICRCWYAG